MALGDLFDLDTYRYAGRAVAAAGFAVGKQVAVNKAAEFAADQVNRVISKNQRGLQKLLDATGLGRGGTSNIYDKLIDRPDPLLEFEFEIVMPVISTPWVYCAIDPLWIEDIDFPLMGFDTEQMKVNGHPVNVIMHSNLSEVTINYYGDYKMQAQAYTDAWNASIRLPNGRYNLPYAPNNIGYKKMIQVILKKGSRPVAVISISGCCPSSRQGYSLKSASDGRIIPTQTLTVDQVYVQLLAGEDPNRVKMQRDGSFGSDIGGSIIESASTAISRRIRGF